VDDAIENSFPWVDSCESYSCILKESGYVAIIRIRFSVVVQSKSSKQRHQHLASLNVVRNG
jgi:hypothetical protein